jgi:carbon storage regulator
MLVLTRKAGEKLIIAGNITITLLSCKRGSIRLGIEAPTGVKVVRAELLRQAASRRGSS